MAWASAATVNVRRAPTTASLTPNASATCTTAPQTGSSAAGATSDPGKRSNETPIGASTRTPQHAPTIHLPVVRSPHHNSTIADAVTTVSRYPRMPRSVHRRPRLASSRPASPRGVRRVVRGTCPSHVPQHLAVSGFACCGGHDGCSTQWRQLRRRLSARCRPMNGIFPSLADEFITESWTDLRLTFFILVA
jgi:hypothetical protein